MSPSWLMICLQTLQCLVFLKVFTRKVWEWRASSSSGCKTGKRPKKCLKKGEMLASKSRSLINFWVQVVAVITLFSQKHPRLRWSQFWPFHLLLSPQQLLILWHFQKLRASRTKPREKKGEDRLTSVVFSPSVILPLPSSLFPVISSCRCLMQLPNSAQHNIRLQLAALVLSIPSYPPLFKPCRRTREKSSSRGLIYSCSVFLRNLHRVFYLPPWCLTVRKCDIIAVQCLLSWPSFWAGTQPAKQNLCQW